MINSLNNQRSLDDVIFENKNKSYGAYELRRSESTTVLKSLSTTTLLFVSLFFVAYYYVNKESKIDTVLDNIPVVFDMGKEVDVTPVEKPKDLPKDKPDTTPKSESGNVTPTDDKSEQNTSTNENQNISSNPNPDGKPADSTETKEITVQKELPKENNDPEKFPDILPQFDGNMQQFIVSNLKYPSVAVSEGAQGVIYVSFIVEKDGSLSNFEILKGKIGYGCEQEAVRVLKSMPNWKVGYKNNKAIRYPCVLPIKFSLK